ncbi:hypothetical protein ACERK3_11825 [Phycisphaerales bacterium AB-hyl4]|uniref:Helix-turn-helix domain-containing protein n=1 Tax=Natronomicrosphaera hydrolytica TaxID=3242702 RepID=A0ABV4U8W1_9BACT
MNKQHTRPSSPASPPSGPLTIEEVAAALAPLADQFPPILSLEQAAKLSHYTPGSLKKLVSQDRFPDSAIRARPLRFWRDRFVLEIANNATSPRRSAKPFEEPAKDASADSARKETRQR